MVHAGSSAGSVLIQKTTGVSHSPDDEIYPRTLDIGTNSGGGHGGHQDPTTLLSILDQLHAAYPSRPAGAPHALALIGLRDVRDYRVERNGSRRVGSSSPFNIKSHSLTLRNFTAEEVDTLYGQHTAETGQAFSEEARARAWELTRGQPWLVNAMAAVLVDELVLDRSETIDAADVEVVKEVLIRRRVSASPPRSPQGTAIWTP